jgi:hypothetical protein
VTISSRPSAEPRVGLEQVLTEEEAADISRNSPEADSTDVHGQYVDPTSGFAFLQRARKRFAPQDENEAADATAETQGHQPVFAAGDKPLLGVNTTAVLPLGDDSVSLLDLYFDVCVATYSIVHRPTVDGWLGMLEHNRKENREPTAGLEKAKVAVLFCLFAIATFHRQKSRGFSEDGGSLLQSDCLFRQAVELTNAETGFARLESIQARILQVFYLLMTCRVTRAWYTFGICLQMVAALGMHRRALKRRGPGKGPDYIHSQCRKRTFWTVYILDRVLGIVFGRPPHFNDEDIDQDLPDRVNDEDMDFDRPKSGSARDDCHTDAFIFNARLAKLIGDISRTLYSLRPLDVELHKASVKRFEEKLDQWQEQLPPFLSTVKPSSLIRSFRRQSVALRMAYCHAIMHLYRPYLLSNTASVLRRSAQDQLQDGIGKCMRAAQEVLKIVDGMARDGPLFHAFWWTHYVTFVSLAIVYVYKIQRIRNAFHDDSLSDYDSGSFFDLAERCHTHLSHATASNSPSRRYSIILEELRTEMQKRHDRVARLQVVSTNKAYPENWEVHPDIELGSWQQVTASDATQSNDVLGRTPNTDLVSWLNEWQSTDWLDLDASVSRTMSRGKIRTQR